MNKYLRDELAARKREESHSKIWFLKALELIKRKEIDPKKVIDIGAGKGEFLDILKIKLGIKDLYALDYAETNIKILKEKNYKAMKVDLDYFNLNEFINLKEKFDLVVSLETIEHIFNLDGLFRLFNFLLKKGGYLLISTPNYAFPAFKLFYLIRGYPFTEGHHIRFLTKRRLREYAFFNGFNLLGYNNYFSFSIDVVRRAFGIKKIFLAKVVSLLLFLPILIISKFRQNDSFVSTGIVVLFKKSNFPPLGFELHNFKEGFDKLDQNRKDLWIRRIKNYLKKDSINDSIYLRDYLRKIVIKK